MTESAYVLIQCDLGREEKVLEEIMALSKDITEVRATYGVYDIVVKVETETQESMSAILLMMRKLPYILSTVTLVVIHQFGGRG